MVSRPRASAPTHPEAAAVYVRISQDGQGSGLGVARQRQDCEEMAQRRGWPVVEVYSDNDTSAYSGKPRPSYRRMLRDIEDGRIDGVITWHLDRLHRQPAELEEFFSTCDRAGLRHMASVSGDVDLSTDDGRFHARILGAVARKESDDKSRRIRRKHRELADRGIHPGSWAMLGYEYDRETKRLRQVSGEARIVRRMFEMYAQGTALRAIARWLDSKGVRGKRGRTRWTNSGVTRILDNPTYAGFRYYEGEFIKGTNWAPIVNADLWEQVRNLRLATKAETPAQNRTGKGNALLAGLLFCKCGAPMWRDSYAKDQAKSAYKCSRSRAKRWGTCEAGSISAPRLESVVRDTFFQMAGEQYAGHVATIPTKMIAPKDDHDDAEQRLQGLEAQMERLIEIQLQASGPLATRKLREKMDALEVEREQLERRRARSFADDTDALRRRSALAELRNHLADLPNIWERAEIDERRAMLRLVLERIDVTTTTRPKRFAITWADGTKTEH